MTVLLLLLLQIQAPIPGFRCGALADSVGVAIASTRNALPFAQRLVLECRDDFDALFRAGRAINGVTRFAEASAADLPLRVRAGELLDRAARLHPFDAAAWFELGLAQKKRGGLELEAYRSIQRALDLARDHPDSTSPALLADIYFQLARRTQSWVDQFRWLKDPHDLAVTTPGCGSLGAFCSNYTRPAEFNERLARAPWVALDLEGERDSVISLYRLVLRLAPGKAEAGRLLLRELALGDEWERAEASARGLAAGGVETGFFSAVAGLAERRLNHLAAADSLMRSAIPLLPDTLRRWYEHPPSGLDTVSDFWRRSRPLWLVPYNELELEYWSRLTYAFLVLGSDEGGVLGPETPQGDALIRYGWPRVETQVVRDARQALNEGQQDAAAVILGCMKSDVGGPVCNSPRGEGMSGDQSGGRWLVWTYESDQPSLIFEQRPSARVARYVFDGAAENYATQLRRASPLTFTSKLAPVTVRVPVQVVRFKGDSAGGTTAVVVYGLVPAGQMHVSAGDSITAGFFVFQDTAGFPAAWQSTGRFGGGPALGLTYRLGLPPGRYAYSFEALAPAYGAAGSTRDSLVLRAWHPDSLQLSDLLLAHRVDPKRDGPSLTWSDLDIDPSRTLTVVSGSSVWVVWETYGLRPGPEGTARYDVSLSVTDLSAKPLPVRLLERLGLKDAAPRAAISLAWTSERPLAPDGRALEYVGLELPQGAVGRYDLTVTVRDPATSRTATTERAIDVTRP
ncbi:MAG TPA: hypothetical protein VFD85_13320 [Gemmatimonadales bacterium]|nr:hypothetical protein [Gemmatimonadales bacterium]HZH41990.1 hypothetical protein [Gemmatimonadales bacterium]